MYIYIYVCVCVKLHERPFTCSGKVLGHLERPARQARPKVIIHGNKETQS